MRHGLKWLMGLALIVIATAAGALLQPSPATGESGDALRPFTRRVATRPTCRLAAGTATRHNPPPAILEVTHSEMMPTDGECRPLCGHTACRNDPGSTPIVDDVIAMTAHGVDGDVMFHHVMSVPVPRLSAADLIRLAEHHVPAEVVKAMQRHHAATPRAESAGRVHRATYEVPTAPFDVRPVAELAASARQALSARLAVLANNLANADTTGFKRSRLVLEGAAYDQARSPGAQDNASNFAPVGEAIGRGVRVQGTQIDLRQGALMPTGRELDLAIEGQGFFQLQDTGGKMRYTRAGNFAVNSQGTVVVGSANIGRPLVPTIQIPPDTTHVSISAEGIVAVQQAGQPLLQQVGQLQLAHFVNPEGLLPLGENLFQETIASGPVQLQNPGEGGVGVIRARALEGSNVDPDAELAEIAATRAALARLTALATDSVPFAAPRVPEGTPDVRVVEELPEPLRIAPAATDPRGS